MTPTGNKNIGYKTLGISDMSPNLVKLKYAEGGHLAKRATEIEKELEHHSEKPFKEVTKANIDDRHAMGQPPIIFMRQVLAVVTYPPLLENYDFPSDVKHRAKELLATCGGNSVGSYPPALGIDYIRRACAEYIKDRDCGIPSNWQDICITGGATNGISIMLKTLIYNVEGKPPGVMIPSPQYPLYSATLCEFGISQIDYYLNEQANWGLDEEELERSYAEACNTCTPRAIVIINPGNPTGHVLTRENIVQVIKFAHKHNLLILADEVHQDNVYTEDRKFYSFKRVMKEMESPYCGLELASFMSCSKGYMGECGLRGGYMELVNFDPEVLAAIYKAISGMFCPTALGQIALHCFVKPPKVGEPSHKLWSRETSTALQSLKERALMATDLFNQMEGISCNAVQGALYCFPKITFPPKAIEKAKTKNMLADVYYTTKLLEETGICMVPGSDFGQKPGTYHFRTTILLQTDKLKTMLETFKTFHAKFVAAHQ